MRKVTGSAGTVMPLDLAKDRMRGPSAAAKAADIAAIDRGEIRRVFSSFRGLHGGYPKRFRGYWLDLAPDGMILRPMLLLGWL